MLPNRYRISSKATRTLGNLKASTGITPNILCRFAFMSSVRNGPQGGLKQLTLDGSEFNLSTLFGEHASAYEYILRAVHGELDPKRCAEVVASHIEDGM